MAAADYIGIFTGFMDSILWIVMLLAVGFVAFVFWQLAKYKIKLVVRKLARGRTVVKLDKARVVKDKNGVVWWKFLKHKSKVAEPPSDCIDIDSKGKQFCEFYQLDASTFVPMKDIIEEHDLHEGRFKLFEPLTTQQRALYTHELMVSDSYKQPNKSELIAKAIPYVALVLILTIFMLFFKEAASPIIEVGQKYIDGFDEINDRLAVLEDRYNPRLPSEAAPSGGGGGAGPPN